MAACGKVLDQGCPSLQLAPIRLRMSKMSALISTARLLRSVEKLSPVEEDTAIPKWAWNSMDAVAVKVIKHSALQIMHCGHESIVEA